MERRSIKLEEELVAELEAEYELENSANSTITAASLKEDPIPIKPELLNADPLGPPPRPQPADPVRQTPDYFSLAHGSAEANPFEASFAFGSSGLETPGGTKLPSLAALTSPSGILGASGTTPNYWGSLRAGPLSPAMLSGPQKDDYFGDHNHLRGGFPTPNESSMRSGLTPGGGGSMFPEPSPNSQAFINQLAAGTATPSTLEFHRAALTANAQKREPNVTSQPQGNTNGMEVKGEYDHHSDANGAAHGLFLLAQQSSTGRNGSQPNHYAMAPSAMPGHAHPQANGQMGGQSSDTSPTGMHIRGNGSISTTSGRGVSEVSDENEQKGPTTRRKGKKGATAANAQTNGRRKAEETPSKAPAAKKTKGNNGHAMQSEPQSEEELDLNKDEYNANGKKMTDEEKRKNFLERNR